MCECGETILLNGHCSTPGCSNKAPERVPTVTKQKPRTQLRKQSKRKRREVKETKAIRAVAAGEQCELCCSTHAVATHEIPAGSHRHKAVYDRRCQLRVCVRCHQHIQSLPFAVQIAMKVKAMVAGINAVHGSIAVTAEDVKEAL